MDEMCGAMSEDRPVEAQISVRSSARRVSDSVRSRLTEMIWSGALSQGERLPTERTLMQQFAVSRAVIREAISELSIRGLLRTRPGYRPIISKPDYGSAFGSMGLIVSNMVAADEQGVWNLFETRMFLEAALARSAAVNARREDIQQLSGALVRNRQAIGDRGNFELTDSAFHKVLYDIPRNPIFPVVHQSYEAWLYERWRQINADANLDRMNYVSHEAIFQAIVDRDPDAAETALRRHLTAAWELVRSTFQATPATDAPASSLQREALPQNPRAGAV